MKNNGTYVKSFTLTDVKISVVSTYFFFVLQI